MQIFSTVRSSVSKVTASYRLIGKFGYDLGKRVKDEQNQQGVLKGLVHMLSQCHCTNAIGSL